MFEVAATDAGRQKEMTGECDEEMMKEEGGSQKRNLQLKQEVATKFVFGYSKRPR